MLARPFNWRTMKVEGPAIRLGETASSSTAGYASAQYADYSVVGDELAIADSRRGSLTLLKSWMKGLK